MRSLGDRTEQSYSFTLDPSTAADVRATPTQRRSARLLTRLALVLLLVIVVAGCSEEQPRPFVDVIEGADGLIRVGQQSGDSSEILTTTQDGQVSEDGGLTWRSGSWDPELIGEPQHEVCLVDTPATCVRFGDEQLTVQESINGGQTWTTVWGLDPSEGWLIPTHGTAIDEITVAGYDLHVLDDDTVIAAVGEVPPLRRSVDGQWTPSIADVRHISSTALVGIIAAVAALALAISVSRLSHPGYRFVRLGTVGAMATAPLLVAVSSWVFAVGDGTLVVPVGVLLSILAMTFAVALLLVAAIDLAQVKSLKLILPSLAIALTTGVAMLLVYWLWSFDIIGYRTWLLAWATIAILGIYGAFRATDTTLPEPQFDFAGPGVLRALAEGTGAMLLLYLLPLRSVFGGGWLVVPFVGCVVMFFRLVRRERPTDAVTTPT